MLSFSERSNIVDEALALSCEDSTLPYEIRAEIDWVDFSCTANPLGTPRCVKDAIAVAIAEGDLSFVPNHAGRHMASLLGRFHEMQPGAFLVGTSPSAMISQVAQAYRPCGVGIPCPAPAEYFLSVANVGHNPVKLTNPYSLSSVDPQTALSSGASFAAAILANPSYPCARLLKESVLEQYLDACSWVVVDETHINLTLGGESFVALTQRHSNLLVIRSISEDLGMPGIPMGYVVGHPDTIAHIRQFSDGTAVGMFPEVVARQLPNTAAFTEQTNRLLDAEIPWMQCMLSLTPGVKVFPSEANYVMCSLEDRAARDFGVPSAAELVLRLQKAGFTVRDLTGLPGIDGNRSFLVAVRAHEDNRRFIAALKEAIVGS